MEGQKKVKSMRELRHRCSIKEYRDVARVSMCEVVGRCLSLVGVVHGGGGD